VLPIESGQVSEQRRIEGFPIPGCGLDRPLYIQGAPERDRCCDENEAAGAAVEAQPNSAFMT